MERRSLNETVAARVAAAMVTAGVTIDTLSEATGIRAATLRDHLDNKSEFTFGELADVGGFFGFSVSSFIWEEEHVDETKVYTRQEFADKYRLGLSTVKALLKSGELAHKRVGAKVLIPAVEAQRWFDALPDQRAS